MPAFTTEWSWSPGRRMASSSSRRGVKPFHKFLIFSGGFGKDSAETLFAGTRGRVRLAPFAATDSTDKGGGSVPSVTPQGVLVVPPLEMMDLPADFDRVMHTAGDRPVEDSLPPLADPTAGPEDVELVRRRQDVEEKQRRVAAFLDASGNDAVVLGRADSIAWFTSGADL